MKKDRLLKGAILLLILLMSVSLSGCGNDTDDVTNQDVQPPVNSEEVNAETDVDTGKDNDEFVGIKNLLPPAVTYLESFSEFGDVSEGFQLWYDYGRKSSSPAFYKLDDSFAEEGMTAYLFCQFSGAEDPILLYNSATAEDKTYIDIRTDWRETNEEVEPREVLAIIQIDKTLNDMELNKVNDIPMDRFYCPGADDITIGYVDWSAILNAPDGELQPAVIDEVNRLFEASISFGNSSFANPNGLHCFMASTYDSIEDMDFKQFLRHFPLESDFKDGEIEALEASDAWKEIHGESTINDIPTPTHHYTVEDINRVLEFYAGIDVSVLDTKDTVHVGDVYYNFTSDFGPGTFYCESGYKEGKTVVLRSHSEVLEEGSKTIQTEVRLEEKDGRYLIKSRKEVTLN